MCSYLLPTWRSPALSAHPTMTMWAASFWYVCVDVTASHCACLAGMMTGCFLFSVCSRPVFDEFGLVSKRGAFLPRLLLI